MIDIQGVLEYLPHRYPFMLVDRIEKFEVGKEIVGYKNVTFNEPFFQGHFPQKPIMPGVLILEAMAQVAGILGVETAKQEQNKDIIYILAGIDGARFKKPVIPGDQLVTVAHITAHKRGIWKFECEAKVNGQNAAKASIILSEQEPFS